jgi:hypothetical protein
LESHSLKQTDEMQTEGHITDRINRPTSGISFDGVREKGKHFLQETMITVGQPRASALLPGAP